MADDFKYHIDHHGSLLTPPDLAESRAAGGDPGGGAPGSAGPPLGPSTP
ncbi:hypothetical protein I6A84_03040 [Frankia sp. CNm7]|nr:hypothetical protein [Frankia nepalensis]MBL7517124.1 hypothetical protein [Frankia nepalensis]